MGCQRLVRVTSPLEEYAPGFAEDLVQLGYVPRVVGSWIRLMAGLSRWLNDEGLDSSGLTTFAAERFLASRRAAGHARFVGERALVPLLEYLRGLGVVPPLAALVLGPVEAMLESYRRHLSVERG